MSKRLLCGAWLIVAATTITIGVRADTAPAYAIAGARLVTAAGAPIASGTIVIRNGLIESVGADVRAPADAIVIDGAGLSV
jgi:imidazolonepropionase-like amidohydrolase